MPYLRTALLASVLAVGLAAHAHAHTDATLRVVHGIPGRDIGTLDPVLPVDVLVNGKICLLKGAIFGSISGPFTLPAGHYSVAVSLASTLNPCTNAAVISADLTLGEGENAAVVAALSRASKPTAYVVPLDFAGLPKGSSRVIVAHTAAAPPVVVTLTNANGRSTTLPAIAPGQSGKAVTASGTTRASVAVAGAAKPVIGPVALPLASRSVTALFAVGSPVSGSLQLLSLVVPDVK